jgi:serine/threonine protein kinase
MTATGGATAPTEDSFPERLSGHKILGEVGSGGMGRVLLAWDEALGRKVAIKTLNRRYRDDEQVRTRFMQEARAMARLSHPNVVHIYSLGQADEPPHFVMEYLEGAALTKAAQALPLRQKIELIHKVVVAVDFLHQHHIVHRDLKPGNVLVGADLEPKVLDFGLARVMDERGRRLTAYGEVVGTPQYFSPEHTQPEAPVDARSDVFSLGTVLYEVLTGTLPFRGETLVEQIRNLQTADPILPRRLDPSIPGDLQKICLKALEKNPQDRYGSARELAADLERYLAGEPVIAAPTSYSRLISGKIEQHVQEVDLWRNDRVISDQEHDSLRRAYERLIEREDAWIMEVRRLSLSQVALYFGAWNIVLGATLLLLFHYGALPRGVALLMVAAAGGVTGYLGVGAFRKGQLRLSVAFLLAFCLLVPITLVIFFDHLGWFTGLTRGDPELELLHQFESFRKITNAQLWWAVLLALPVYLRLRRMTRASVYSLVFASMTAVLAILSLLRLGLIEFFEDDPGWLYFRLIPVALIYFAMALPLERLRLSGDSRYFYPFAVVFTFIALSGLAGAHEPYADLLQAAFPWTRGQIEYLFIINAGIYLALHAVCESVRTPQMRSVAKVFRFVVPGHIMTSLLILGLEATDRYDSNPDGDPSMAFEARLFEVLLPVVAAAFVFLSIPKQMKNYLATGLLFLAVGVVRLQQNWLEDEWLWPVGLLIAGTALMFVAVRYPRLRVLLQRWTRALRPKAPQS